MASTISLKSASPDPDPMISETASNPFACDRVAFKSVDCCFETSTRVDLNWLTQNLVKLQ